MLNIQIHTYKLTLWASRLHLIYIVIIIFLII